MKKWEKVYEFRACCTTFSAIFVLTQAFQCGKKRISIDAHSQSHIDFHCNRHQFSLALHCATRTNQTNRKHVKQCSLARSVCDHKTPKPICMPSMDFLFNKLFQTRCEFVTVSLEFEPQRVHNVVCMFTL